MGDDQASGRRTNAGRLSPPGPREAGASDARPLAFLQDVAYLGGYVPVTAISVGQRYDVAFLEDRLLIAACHQAEALAALPYSEIEDIEIGGPGLVRSGGGFFGGGFGVTGAVEGMAIASVLNALTSRTSIQTVVRIQGTNCELFLLDTWETPGHLRIQMSHALGVIQAARPPGVAGAKDHGLPTRSASPVEELAKLADMVDRGLLTRKEFDLMKARLLAP
jgi:hypothetical protein